MAAGTCIRLFVVVLCFSYLIRTNGAIPLPGSRHLKQKHQSFAVSKRILSGKKSLKMEITTMRRMEMEVNDYPGSGANNRHTPRSQLGRGCFDC